MSTKRIRVLHVLDKLALKGATIHGVSRLLLAWFPAFQQSDYELLVCVLRGREGGKSRFRERGIPVIDLDRNKYDPRTILDVYRLVRDEDIDIVHCHGYGSSTFGRIAARLSNVPVIVHEHMMVDGSPLHQRAADRLLAPLTAKSIAVSHAVAESIEKHRYLPRENTTVIYNAITANDSPRAPDPPKDQLANEIGIAPNKPIVGIVGRLDPIKGHSIFLHAVARALQQIPQIQCLIVGDGELAGPLADEAARLGICENVHFLGHRNDVFRVMRAFDVYVSCSIAEGLGMAILEAMSLGRPIVATDVGGVSELIEDKISGLLVRSNDAAAIGDALIYLLGNADVAALLGNQASARYRELFRPQIAIGQLFELYSGLASSSHT